MPVGSIQSTVRLGFEHDAARDRTVLRHRKAGGLCHAGKGYWNDEVLGLHLVNPTAGIFAGDRLELDVDVGCGARVSLVSPSATRFHTMESGAASLSQTFRVGREAWLDFQPEWTIPQAGSEVEQATRIELAPSAALSFVDLLAPGRVAHGECHAYRRIRFTFELLRDGIPVARERMDLSPAAGGWPLAVEGWDACFHAACWFAGDAVGDAATRATLAELEAEFDGSGLRCGFTCLTDDVAVLRILAARSLAVRQALRRVRERMAAHLPLLARGLRRL